MYWSLVGLTGVPVGQTERLTIGSVKYQLPWVQSLSLSVTVTSVDDRMASSDNRLSSCAPRVRSS